MTRRASTFAVLGTVAALSPAASATVAPRPQTVPAIRQWRGAAGTLRLTDAARIVVLPGRRNRALAALATRLAEDVRAADGLRLRRGAGRPRRGDIVLTLGASDRALGAEGYRLTIGGAISISARTATGAFYGTRTLLQLLWHRRVLSRGTARDWPRYPERGLMIDLGRRAYPERWIETELAQMAALKLNTLHLHLTDDQRWGLQSRTDSGIASPGALSTAAIRRIIAAAARNHVTIVPEIDMPGHVGALLARHPELELHGLTPAPGGESRKLDITNPAALTLVHRLLDEYLPLFPGPYWDVGADEYLGPADLPRYPQLAVYALARYGAGAVPQDAVIGFINWVDGIVRAHHKTMRAWHDELRPGSVIRARPDIVVDWWTNISPLSDPSPPTPAQLLAAGHRITNEGWFPTYDTGDVGPVQGMPDMRAAYESWSVNAFCGPTIGGRLIAPCSVVPAGDRRNLGSSINAWDNRGLTLAQIGASLVERLPVLAQKTWDSPELTGSYAAFRRIVCAAGAAPRC